jgi:hypothetical protein
MSEGAPHDPSHTSKTPAKASKQAIERSTSHQNKQAALQKQAPVHYFRPCGYIHSNGQRHVTSPDSELK